MTTQTTIKMKNLSTMHFLEKAQALDLALQKLYMLNLSVIDIDLKKSTIFIDPPPRSFRCSRLGEFIRISRGAAQEVHVTLNGLKVTWSNRVPTNHLFFRNCHEIY